MPRDPQAEKGRQAWQGRAVPQAQGPRQGRQPWQDRRRHPIVACVHLPRFELAVAAGGRRALEGRALALLPAIAGRPMVGEVSAAAQRAGVVQGMALGEALARCPRLELLPDDPLAVARAWERAACALEAIGAAVELERPGLACFDARALVGLHGGLEGVVAATGRALGGAARIGVGSARFCALAAAREAGEGEARVVEAEQTRAYLAAQPVSLLAFREPTAALVEPLLRLGIRTLGELAALGGPALSDRFGEPGLHARRLALGQDAPPRPREAPELLEESLELEQGSSREALERALDVLLDRLLARGERRGRRVRAMRLFARLVAGGTWCERIVFRQALGERRRMRLALGARLELLPAPAAELGLAVDRFGEAGGEQCSLLGDEGDARTGRLQDAVGQVRTLAGPEGALRLLPVEPRSRIPERRFALTPFSP
jgi:protein ImuB